MTTDHISPAGWIDPDGEAGRWLIAHGADPQDLNVYASYRGNWEVMLRGLSTNRLARNHLAPDLPAAHTILEGGAIVPIHLAAAWLADAGVSTVILAGERYGMGSSRDWAAKGVGLLGVRAVIARSFERIHRSNLIGMGVMPVEIADDFDPTSWGMGPDSRIEIDLTAATLAPRKDLPIKLVQIGNNDLTIRTRVAVETALEVEFLKAGGVLPSILRRHGKKSTGLDTALEMERTAAANARSRA